MLIVTKHKHLSFLLKATEPKSVRIAMKYSIFNIEKYSKPNSKRTDKEAHYALEPTVYTGFYVHLRLSIAVDLIFTTI
jgi:hypothetical protein